MKYKAVATCAFGLESVLAFELRRLGAEDISAADGRITFWTDEAGLARANIRLRTAERVLMMVAEYPAATFDQLFDGAQEMQWGELIDPADGFPVKGYSMHSTLTSVPACQAVLKKAIAERLKRDHHVQTLPEDNSVTKRIQFSLVKDVCTLMLDTSGDGLHKRGYRPLMNEAPIKETLAAGIADLARIFPESHAADPFCGSGTLLIEAALRAKNMAPGLKRPFAAEQYRFLGRQWFEQAREEARAEIDSAAGFCGRGFDIDSAAVEIARKNAERAGVADCLSFQQGDARQFAARADEIILANPPYGERLMSEREAEQLYAAFGANMAGQRYKGLYMISSHSEFERVFGKKASRRRKLYNGMIPCQLFMYF